MHEPILFGYPIHLLFLYFMIYAFLGWCMETVYCSTLQHRLVPRGFLFGPICPIYGVGVLMMICWFAPFMDYPVLFYVVATVCMSAWEYFVGWFLETATHIKYWDYSHIRFNIKGRVCLPVSLFWGIMSYIAVFLIHPPVVRLMHAIPDWVRYLLCGSTLTLLLVDTVTTIRKLALVTKAMDRLQSAGDELRLQLALARADLGDNIEEAGEALRRKLNVAREGLPAPVVERLDSLMDDYDELLAKAERHSRRFRNRYAHMTSRRYTLDDVRAAGAQLKEHIRTAKAERKADKQAAKRH